MSSASASQPDTANCAECGRTFPLSELMAFADFHACAECKPAVIEKLKSGALIGRFWRWGPSLVAAIPVEGEIEFPSRCIGCNGKADLTVSVRSFTVPGRRRIDFRYFTCDHEFRRDRKIAMLSKILGASLAITVGIFIGGPNLTVWPTIGFFAVGIILLLSMVGMVVCGLWRAAAAGVLRIADTFVLFHGCKPAFLKEFPKWPKA